MAKTILGKRNANGDLGHDDYVFAESKEGRVGRSGAGDLFDEERERVREGEL